MLLLAIRFGTIKHEDTIQPDSKTNIVNKSLLVQFYTWLGFQDLTPDPKLPKASIIRMTENELLHRKYSVKENNL